MEFLYIALTLAAVVLTTLALAVKIAIYLISCTENDQPNDLKKAVYDKYDKIK